MNDQLPEDDHIRELIESKITPDNADGSWIIALMLMRSVQLQKEISNSLNSLVVAIGDRGLTGEARLRAKLESAMAGCGT